MNQFNKHALKKFFKGPEEEKQILDPYIDIIDKANEMKLNGLYVDVYKGQIRTPKSEVSKEKAEQILDLMNNFATGFVIRKEPD